MMIINENKDLEYQVMRYKEQCADLEEERDKYRNMVFDKDEQLTKAKELLKEFVHHYKAKTIYVENMQDLLKQSEQFLSEVEK